MDVCPHHQPRAHGGPGDREVRDKSLLTSFNIDGERFLNTSSEPREWLLRASATLSNGRVLRVLGNEQNRSSWLFFSFSCSQGQYLLSPPADHHRAR
jgi:hypothetical protein